MEDKSSLGGMIEGKSFCSPVVRCVIIVISYNPLISIFILIYCGFYFKEI